MLGSIFVRVLFNFGFTIPDDLDLGVRWQVVYAADRTVTSPHWESHVALKGGKSTVANPYPARALANTEPRGGSGGNVSV